MTDLASPQRGTEWWSECSDITEMLLYLEREEAEIRVAAFLAIDWATSAIHLTNDRNTREVLALLLKWRVGLAVEESQWKLIGSLTAPNFDAPAEAVQNAWAAARACIDGATERAWRAAVGAGRWAADALCNAGASRAVVSAGQCCYIRGFFPSPLVCESD